MDIEKENLKDKKIHIFKFIFLSIFFFAILQILFYYLEFGKRNSIFDYISFNYGIASSILYVVYMSVVLCISRKTLINLAMTSLFPLLCIYAKSMINTFIFNIGIIILALYLLFIIVRVICSIHRSKCNYLLIAFKKVLNFSIIVLFIMGIIGFARCKYLDTYTLSSDTEKQYDINSYTSKMNKKKKIDYIQSFVNQETSYMNLPNSVRVIICHYTKKSGIVGLSKYSQNTIYITDTILDDKDKVIHVVLHELFHFFERSCIESESNEKYIELFNEYFEYNYNNRVESWKQNYDNYFLGVYANEEEYQKYIIQPVEMDSEIYANLRSKEIVYLN